MPKEKIEHRVSANLEVVGRKLRAKFLRITVGNDEKSVVESGTRVVAEVKYRNLWRRGTRRYDFPLTKTHDVHGQMSVLFPVEDNTLIQRIFYSTEGVRLVCLKDGKDGKDTIPLSPASLDLRKGLKIFPLKFG